MLSCSSCRTKPCGERGREAKVRVRDCERTALRALARSTALVRTRSARAGDYLYVVSSLDHTPTGRKKDKDEQTFEDRDLDVLLDRLRPQVN